MSHRSMVGTQICPYLDWKCPDISANWRCYNDYCLCDLSACSGLCYNSQWGRCGEGHNIHESICWSHQEPMDWPWDPAMLQSEERIPDLRLSRIVSGNRDQINISSLFQVPLILILLFVPSSCVHSYLDALNRITDAAYMPSQQDVLRVSAPTTGVMEYRFEVDKCIFRWAN